MVGGGLDYYDGPWNNSLCIAALKPELYNANAWL